MLTLCRLVSNGILKRNQCCWPHYLLTKVHLQDVPLSYWQRNVISEKSHTMRPPGKGEGRQAHQKCLWRCGLEHCRPTPWSVWEFSTRSQKISTYKHSQSFRRSHATLVFFAEHHGSNYSSELLSSLTRENIAQKLGGIEQYSPSASATSLLEWDTTVK